MRHTMIRQYGYT